MSDITWHEAGPHEVVATLNGWAAAIWDFGSHPAQPPHPEGRPFNWGVRPRMSFDPYDREGFAASLELAKAEAERALRELAAQPAPQDKG